jgi:hypothetical protein
MSGTGVTELPPDIKRGGQILAICGTLTALCLVLVTLRTWVRARIIKVVWADDWVMIGTMVSLAFTRSSSSQAGRLLADIGIRQTVLFVEMMIIIPQVQYGAGRQYIKPASNVVTGLHLNFVTQPLCLIALCLTKVSVGFFLLRLTPERRLRRFIIGTIVFTVLSATGNLCTCSLLSVNSGVELTRAVTVFFQCKPLAYTWGGTATGTCIPPAHLKFAAFFNSSVSVLTDVVFALLPIPMLWNVQMNWRIKTAVGAILSLGIL